MKTSRSLVQLSALLLAAFLFTGCAARNIWEASRNGNYDQVKQILADDPAQVNAVHMDAIKHDRNNKWTPLHYAAHYKQKRVVELLLENGADPLAKSRGGWTPLHEARQSGNKAIEEMITENIKEQGLEMP